MSTVDLAAVYRRTHDRLVTLATDLAPADLATPVPACPAWTVRDVYAHVAGVAADRAAGNDEGAPGAAWTARQVAARRDLPLATILEEWEETAPRIEALLAREGRRRAALAVDLWTHEQDIRNALARPGHRSAEGLLCALGAAWLAVPRIDAAGLPALRILTAEVDWRLGEDPRTVTLRADGYELARALLGRRSRDQMRAFSWDGPAEPYLGLLTVFPPRPDPLVE